MTQLAGKVALVTGGARGICRGSGRALARAGADVAIAEVERVASATQQYGDAAVGGFTVAKKTAEEIIALGRRSIAIQADVTRKNDTREMVRETVEKLGGLDVLVCNAGVVSVSPVATMTEEAFDLTIAVNVKGVFLSCQAAIPEIQKRSGGSDLHNPSVTGKNGFPGVVPHCGTKDAGVGVPP